MNVIKKIVIPRTNVTVGYILAELEEIAREEFTRLKKVKEKKKRDRELKEKKAAPVPSNTPEETEIVKNIDDTELIPCCEREIEELYTSSESIHSKISTSENNRLDRLVYLKSLLNDLILYGKDLLLIGIEKIDINDFLKTCEQTIFNIDEHDNIDDHSTVIKYANLNQKLADLNIHLTKVVDLILEFKPEIILSPSVENFICESQDVGIKIDIFLQTISTEQNNETQKKIEELTDMIHDVKKITTEYESNKDIDECIKSREIMDSKLKKSSKTAANNSCRKAMFKLDQSCKCAALKKIEENNYERKLKHVKIHLHEVIDIMTQIKPELKLPFNIEKFAKMCQEVEEKLNIYKSGEFTAHERVATNNLMELRDLITCVTDIVQDYKKSGVIFSNIDEFLLNCNDIKTKIDIWTQPSTNLEDVIISPENKKIIDSFSQDKVGTDLEQLKQHIDDSINLSREAIAEGVIRESVEDMIKAFEEIKGKIESESLQPPKVILDLQLNLQEVINIIRNLKEEGIIKFSVEDFLKLCDQTGRKLHIKDQKSSKTSQKGSNLECVESGIDKIGPKLTLLSDIPIKPESDKKPMCDTCCNTLDFKKPTNESFTSVGKLISAASSFPCNLCDFNIPSNETVTCSNSGGKQHETKATSLIISPEPSLSCNLCKLIAKQKKNKANGIKKPSGKEITTEAASACDLCKLLAKKSETEVYTDSQTETKSLEKVRTTSSERESRASKIETTAEGVKENLGYFEMQKHKIVKVRKRQNKDGTVWEEKETITINKVRRDPTINSLCDYDEDNASDDSLDKGNTKHVNLCTLSCSNSKVFDRFIKVIQSDIGVKNTLVAEPYLRQCVSLDNVFYF